MEDFVSEELTGLFSFVDLCSGVLKPDSFSDFVEM